MIPTPVTDEENEAMQSWVERVWARCDPFVLSVALLCAAMTLSVMALGHVSLVSAAALLCLGYVFAVIICIHDHE